MTDLALAVAAENRDIMAKRTYNMYCALSKALDVLGERWTLLLVHELLSGPKRFKDLLDNLPGIGTNLLSKRLKELEKHGVVRRATLPPPAASEVYELSPRGRELEDVVLGLSRWGTSRLGLPKKGELFRPVWAIYAMKDRFRPERAEGVAQTYEFRVDGDVFHVRVEDQQAFPAAGPGWRPDVVISMSAKTLLAIGTYQLSPQSALEQGRVRLEGDPDAYRRYFELFHDEQAGLPPYRR